MSIPRVHIGVNASPIFKCTNNIFNMSFSRAIYDKCAYEDRLESTAGPGAYKLSTPTVEPCLQSIPEFGTAAAGGHRGARQELVDIDSELMGINVAYSRCKRPFSQAMHAPVKFRDCATETTQSSRLNNPPCTLRCNGVNRFHLLHHDPQQRSLELPFLARTSSRTVFKDNHRPCLEQPLDATSALPPLDASTTRGAPPTDVNFMGFRNPPMMYT
jgi:hypothetical protein